MTSVACALGPSVNPLQNREIQYVNIVLQYINFLLELNGKAFKCYHISTDFSFQNLNFWNLFDFSAAENT
jgi:hypothetical protein